MSFLMQDGPRCKPPLRALVYLSGALAGLLMILVGSMIPSGLILPTFDFPLKVIDLPSTWQVPAVLLCSLVCGPKLGVVSAAAYLTIGLFYLPIFHNGGSLSYVLNPGFGYLMGFIPAAWLSGRLAEQVGMNNFLQLTISALAGLILVHFFGVMNLTFGSLISLWQINFSELVFNYTILPLPAQLALCPAVGILAITMRRLLFIK